MSPSLFVLGLLGLLYLPLSIAHPAAHSNFTVALIRSAPANWPEPFWNKNWTGVTFDISKTVDKAIDHIAEASANGAELVAFPELWFPGYPKGIDETWIQEHAEDYFDNSIVVGDENWRRLLRAASRYNTYLALAFSHRQDQAIYMAQALITPQAEVLHLRHKLRPSGVERSLWSDGTTEGLKVLNTTLGRVGLLECWEHFHPSMTFNMQAQIEDIHIASAPYTPDYNDPLALSWETAEVNAGAVRTYAVNSGAVTLFPAVGYAAVFDEEGIIIAEMNASVCEVEHPILYASVSKSGFRNKTYDSDGEQSWATLQQIVQGFPSYVPKVNGSYVARQTHTLEDILSQ